MTKKIQVVRGMNDILPDETFRWEFFEQTIQEWLAAYGYRNIRMPIVEQTDLFVRSIGSVTDIVEKEMYTFVDHLNGESLTLRPEGTASCVRAVIANNLLYASPQRLSYSGPMFRHERPQKGRYRQFHQVGVEALGYTGPDIDAEHIVMCARLWKQLGISGVRLEIGTLGSVESRVLHRERLIKYYESHLDALDEDARRRLHSNPLRILDSKNPDMREINKSAPKLIDDLDEDSRVHFVTLQQILRNQGIDFEINLQLVRGLDYYNRTVFEWVTDSLGAQGTVCAGGRYDGLVEQLGGKATPAVGFAMGLERLVLLLQALESVGDIRRSADVYLAAMGDKASIQAPLIAAQLRKDVAGLRVMVHAGGGNFKKQLKRADKSDALVAVIIGEDELEQGVVTIKYLRERKEQVTLKLEEAKTLLAELI